MMRSVLALAALVAFMVGAGAAFACGDPPLRASNLKQTVVSADGKSKPITVPKSDKDS
jgi:hypothetical protein